jgi:hypothetical protein
MRKTVEERFNEKVAPPDENGCKIWTASWRYSHPGDERRRYGQFKFEGRIEKAHRVALYLAGIEIPEGSDVHHACPGGPNTLCMEVSHLRVVTRKEHRAIDASGEKNKNSKLTDERVAEMRKRYALGGVSYTTLAEEFGVASNTAANIVRGRWWKHADGPRVQKSTLSARRQAMSLGEGNPAARLTENDVRLIRFAIKSGRFTRKDLAVCLGVCLATIDHITSGKTWVHVKGDWP